MNTAYCRACNDWFLTNLVEAGMPVVCPTCIPIYSIAKNVSNSNVVSQDVKNIAGVVCGGILLFVTALCLDHLIESLKS